MTFHLIRVLGMVVGLAAMLAVASIAAAAPQSDQQISHPIENRLSKGDALERIKRQLDRLPPTHTERSVLRLSYYIEVYGRLPRIDLVQGFDVHNGPVPYGAPTHAELLAVMSPRELRPAVAKLNSIIGWTFKSLNAPS